MADLNFSQGADPVAIFNDTSGNQLAINTDGSVNINTASVTVSSVTNVASSATSVTLLAANSSRKMAIFYNDSVSSLELKLGATASATSFTVEIPSQGYYELPLPVYTGIIDGIWTVANGAVRVTELT